MARSVYQLLNVTHDDMSSVSSAAVVLIYVFFELDVTSTAGTGWISGRAPGAKTWNDWNGSKSGQEARVSSAFCAASRPFW